MLDPDLDLPLPPELASTEASLTDEDLDVFAAAVLAAPDEFDLPDLLKDDGPMIAVPAPVRRWTIEDDEAAEWALRKLTEAETAVDRAGARAEGWIKRIQDWRAKVSKPLLAKAAFFRYHLDRYAVEERLQHERKTIPLPSGKISTRPAGGAVQIEDKAAVLAWLETVPVEERRGAYKPADVSLTGLRDLLQVKVEGKRGEPQEALILYGGEPVPGVRWEPEIYSPSVTAG